MHDVWKEATWSQFGAAIDMLENAIVQCPEALWDRSLEPQLSSSEPQLHSHEPQFWYLVFHTLFWLDLYLSKSIDGFAPPAPFTLDELDPRGLMPDRAYTKSELLAYLEHGRRKCRETILGLTEEDARAVWAFRGMRAPGAEMLLYNFRHLQHHVAQLNLMMRQTENTAPDWVSKVKSLEEP